MYLHWFYTFQHLETKEIFKGTRKEFENKFNLNGGRLSQLINNKVLKYKNWIKIWEKLNLTLV